jgi:dipeptidyl aminopeptidase/acylaminoacyl peptidase
MAKTQSIKFTTEDGLDIYSYLTLPVNIDETAKPPLVTMVHGGPHAPYYDIWGFDGMVQFLANRGYAVLQVNYRGSGGFGKAFEEAGFRQWGGKMIDDITDATQNVVDQGLVDGNRMCIYGASYGGYASLMSVVRQPDLFKCAIGYVGVYNLEYMYTDSDITMRDKGENYLEMVIGNDKAELAKFSPVHFADKIKANVFLIHGEKDARVSVRNSEEMRDALIKAGKQVPYLNFSNSGHGVYDEEGRRLLYSEIEKYLAQQL